jgi:hypothetical protein
LFFLHTHQQTDRVVGYGPFFLCVIHKEGLCPSSGDINRLMMMMMMPQTDNHNGNLQSDGDRLTTSHVCSISVKRGRLAGMPLLPLRGKNVSVCMYVCCIYLHIQTYYSRFISEGVAEASQMFLQGAYIIPT